MNILIIGAGLLGRKAAELLDAAGHVVAVLDESADRLSLLPPEFRGVAGQGVPMDVKALKNMGVEGCDAVAVVTSNDNLNITVGQIVRDYFHIPKVIVRVNDPSRENVFENLGLETMCPTNMAGDRLVSALTSPRQNRQATFGVNTVSFLTRPVEKKYFGGTTADLEPAPGDGILGVLKENGRFRLLEPGAALPLEPGDSVVYSRKID